jgi:hypothetical protein
MHVFILNIWFDEWSTWEASETLFSMTGDTKEYFQTKFFIQTTKYTLECVNNMSKMKLDTKFQNNTFSINKHKTKMLQNCGQSMT